MTVLEQIKELERQKQQLLAQAKQEALENAEAAIKTLGELGFQYRLVESEAPSTSPGKRRTGIREEVLAIVKGSRNGLKRAEVLDAVNATDKSAQQSVSNALAALKKSGQLTLNNGTYKAA